MNCETLKKMRLVIAPCYLKISLRESTEQALALQPGAPQPHISQPPDHSNHSYCNAGTCVACVKLLSVKLVNDQFSNTRQDSWQSFGECHKKTE